jgi:hypothetical protein
MELQIGDWVGFNGVVGFVEEIDLDDIIGKPYLIIFTKNRMGQLVNIGMWKSEDDLIKIPPYLEMHEIEQLIDLALVMGDKEWFMELTEQLKFERAW